MYPGSKRKLDVRLFLWGLFLLQISLICLFLIFGALLVSTSEENAVDDGQTAEQQLSLGADTASNKQRPIFGAVSGWSAVQFISNRTAAQTDNQNTPEGRMAHSLSSHSHRAPYRAYHDDASDGQLLSERKQLRPRHPKYRPWIQRDLPAPERAKKVFRSVSYADWHGKRQQRLCFIEGTRQNATTASQQVLRGGSKTNETELVDTGMDTAKVASVGKESELSNDYNDDGKVIDDEGNLVAVGGDGVGRCRCNAQWHGADCGQPEVIWRAFITSKIAVDDQTATPRTVARNVFYIVQSTFVSVEILEVQLMELLDQVSLFVLCDRQPNPLASPLPKDVAIADHVETTDFLRGLRNRLLIVSDATCSGRNVFRKLQKYTTKTSIRPDDIVLVSGTDEILNRKAVAYLRWYDNWPQPVRFRLKHNVYGFFWQHQPNSTVIGSAAVQVSTLREVYASDPDRLLAIDKPVMLIGDLNHFGGWYCRRCYQPGAIVRYFEQRAAYQGLTTDARQLYLPDPKRTNVLNEAYVQQLIASGKDLEDGERALERLSRRTDKYYEPEYVRDNSWKFDNIVLNLYARWEDNLADDDYFS
ncbi:beta-1,4-mannosyl-glycoprotein 4-beta-N-acetylglucosaminyltransferase [Anopheles bellator]|uniref:beta-1,4-mannosyl-glycoprotein 4-beta-N-acetylglucosaminyltransferase n=1 Tax=Anopheles bellator TaxID=139047 RepID=UPI002646FFC5|nr:beta-1,4-mannosyl-glycoprotein 4-beta-N-acetylglucosaminyltransferase [Anopheles bellator]